MNETEPDERLIYGAVIAAEMRFELDFEPASAATFGRDAAPEPGCFCLRFKARPLVEVALEGPVKALSLLTGTLSVCNQRERTQRLGRFSRESDGYRIDLNLFEPELDRFLKLMSFGLRPRTLKLEFDIEVPQWFDLGEYWDDVRYPWVDIHEHWIEWGPPNYGGPVGRA